MVGISFYTLFERKLLASSHLRSGPIIIRMAGLLQPLSDGLKLFTKRVSWLAHCHFMLYLVSPCFTLFRRALLVCCIPSEAGGLTGWVYLPMMLLIVMSIGLLPLLLTGWGANTSWSLLGVLRCVAQTVSYEVRVAFMLVGWVWVQASYGGYSVGETTTPLASLCIP